MATQITAWKSSDGSVHEHERGALIADARHSVNRWAEELADELRPPYGDAGAIKRELLEGPGCGLALKFADAVLTLRALEPT